MITLIELEILRVLRNRRYLIFTLILPAVLFTLMVDAYGKAGAMDGVSVKEYFMVAMATLGTVSAAMTSNANRIALERKSGWARQLRLTALPGYGYVVAKIASTAASTLPAILVVFALAYAQGVRLSGSEWVLLGLTLWVGGFVFAALGVALGYSAAPDSIQPIIMIVYTVMLILGGTYGQIGGSFGTFAKWTPVALYNQFGRVAQTGASVGMGSVVAVLAYALCFGGLAAFLYQRDRREA
jgi:ABC-2 type transport system permease protein